MLTTEIGKNYWNNTGLYQEDYNDLYKKHVPASGPAATLNGELIRAISRLSYEYYNNGNCNACDNEEEWDEKAGTYHVSTKVNEFFEKFLSLIEKTVPDVDEYVDEIRYFIIGDYYGNTSQFSDVNKQKYNLLFDYVINYVMTTPDTDLPNWYKK